MRSRFLYFLLASVLFHVVVLGFPFSVTTGGLGSRALGPVRVHLLTSGETIDGSGSKESEKSMQQTAMAPIEHDSTTSTLSPVRTPATRQTQTVTRASQVEKKNTDDPHRTQPKMIPVRRSPTPKKQAILRTTTVYAGSAAARSSASGARVGTGVRSAPAGAQRATVPTTRDGSQPSQPGSFSRVRYARVVKPEYPEQARAQGWEGTTLLKVLVDPAGKSEQVRVQRTSGFTILDDAAVNAMQRWEFHPARYGREAVQSWVSVPIVFKLKEEN